MRILLENSFEKSYEGAVLYIVLGKDPATLLKCDLFYRNFSKVLSGYL